mgnify:CR=1 FL=1
MSESRFERGFWNVLSVVPKPVNEPWICPRCGTVNAWWVASCRCKPNRRERVKGDD